MEMYKKKGVKRIRACTLVEQHADEIKALFAEGIAVLEEALEAERIVLGRDGDPVRLGPDHGIRMAAMKLHVALCLRSRRSPVEPDEEAPPWTFEEFMDRWEEGLEEQAALEKEQKKAALIAAKQPPSNQQKLPVGPDLLTPY
jgi:hypothetical protein